MGTSNPQEDILTLSGSDPSLIVLHASGTGAYRSIVLPSGARISVWVARLVPTLEYH